MRRLRRGFLFLRLVRLFRVELFRFEVRGFPRIDFLAVFLANLRFCAWTAQFYELPGRNTDSQRFLLDDAVLKKVVLVPELVPDQGLGPDPANAVFQRVAACQRFYRNLFLTQAAVHRRACCHRGWSFPKIRFGCLDRAAIRLPHADVVHCNALAVVVKRKRNHAELADRGIGFDSNPKDLLALTCSAGGEPDIGFEFLYDKTATGQRYQSVSIREFLIAPRISARHNRFSTQHA